MPRLRATSASCGVESFSTFVPAYLSKASSYVSRSKGRSHLVGQATFGAGL